MFYIQLFLKEESILPYFYSRQLLKDERFPDSIKGKPVTFRDAQLSSFTFRVSPKDINSPKIGLYQLLESMSPRVKLETSDDVFRFTKSGVEFIDCETNALNQEKSRLFTEMFQKKDFKFPVKHIDGLPSPRKDYDEGYILVDADNQLYHFKQTVGRPYLRKIDAPENVKIKYGYITAFNDKKSIAFAVDTDNNLYIVENKTYKFHKVGVPSFDPEKNAMMILGNMSDWTVKVSSIDKVVYYAIDANDYSLLKEYSEPMDESFGTKVDDFIASIGIRFTHPLDKFVYPRIGY